MRSLFSNGRAFFMGRGTWDEWGEGHGMWDVGTKVIFFLFPAPRLMSRVPLERLVNTKIFLF
jgi:hypothetical protein